MYRDFDLASTKNMYHCHSMYSLHDSTMTPEEMVIRAKEMGVKNLVLTDHGTLLGINSFMAAGKEYAVNTIPGLEAYCQDRTHLILIAKNYRGFQAISAALRAANEHIEETKGRLKYPIMTDEILECYFRGNENIIATSACIQGPMSYILLRNKRALRSVRKYLIQCDELSQSAEQYESLKKQCCEIDIQIKEAKKRLSDVAKFLKPAHKKKVMTLETRLENVDPDSAKYKDTLQKLTIARESTILGETMSPVYQRDVDSLTQEKKALQARMKEAKKLYDKYNKAKAIVDAVQIEDENDLFNKATQRLIYLKSIFPNFYIELQNHGLENESYVMPLLARIAEHTHTPVMAANDAHMKDNSEDSIEARRIVRYNYFKKAQSIDPADRTLYMKTNTELYEALCQVVDSAIAEQAIMNLNVLECCNVEFPKENHYPSIKTSETLDELLEIERQRRVRLGIWNDEYQARLEYEVQTIKSMGYVDYHLVVRDFCNVGRILGRIPKNRSNEMPSDFDDAMKWTQKNGFNDGVGIGPGRGSAAGSLVCYMLGITNIDPIKYNLLFERFLNPERVSMPDIDTDVRTSLRSCIIQYLKWRYGEKSVCSIATETTYAAKGAIKMVGRDRADQLYGHLPAKEANPLKQAYNRQHTYRIADAIEEDLSNENSRIAFDSLNPDDEDQIIWARAKLIEGRLSGTGVHAGGVIISDNDNVNDYVPLAWNDEKQVWVAQCDMVQAEEKGLLKMDLLGLNTLDCISDTISYVKKYRNISVDIDNVPFEPEVFEKIYAAGATNSVFQFESDGMKSMLKQFKPTCFEDIILLVACYRPGPMQYLDDIIAVKNGKKPLTFKHKLLEPILSTTYGATVYQEQVMQIFQSLAGYSLGGADLVRRAMSKKKVEKLAHERTAFVYGDSERGIDGCIKRGVSKEIANELFDEMMNFALYAFNKSHAAAYAFVSYQTAYLKYHFTPEFLCAMLNNKEQADYKPILRDCVTFGIQLLPPDINFSYFNFTLEGDRIRYGLKGIKDIGEANEQIMQSVCVEREKKYFHSVQDFLKRGLLSGAIFPRDVLKTLFSAGVFDCFQINRESLIRAFIEDITISTQEDMADIIDKVRIEHTEMDISDNIRKEADYLGVILRNHPLDSYHDAAMYQCTEIENIKEGMNVSVFGFVSSVNISKTKTGKNIVHLTIEGKTSSCLAMLMNQAYARYIDVIESYCNRVVRISGRAVGSGSLFADTISYLEPEIRTYYMKLKTWDDVQIVKAIKEKSGDKGTIPVATLHQWTSTGERKKNPVVRVSYFTIDELESLKRSNIEISTKKVF